MKVGAKSTRVELAQLDGVGEEVESPKPDLVEGEAKDAGLVKQAPMEGAKQDGNALAVRLFQPGEKAIDEAVAARLEALTQGTPFTHNARSQLPMGGKARQRSPLDKDDLRRQTDRGLMRLGFRPFLEQCVERGLDLSQRDIDELEAVALKWNTPWEVSSFGFQDKKVEINIGGLKMECGLGKAYMLSDWSPRWEGVFFVNQIDTPAGELSSSYCQRSIGKSDERIAQQEEAIQEGLNGKEAEQLRAIKTIVERGGKKWIRGLQQIADANQDLKAVVEDAIEHLTGKAAQRQLTERAHNPKLKLEKRKKAVDLTVELGLDAELLIDLIRNPVGQGDSGMLVAEFALSKLIDRLPDQPDLVKREFEAYYDRLWESIGVWRTDALELLERMPPEHCLPLVAEYAERETNDRVIEHLYNVLKYKRRDLPDGHPATAKIEGTFDKLAGKMELITIKQRAAYLIGKKEQRKEAVDELFRQMDEPDFAFLKELIRERVGEGGWPVALHTIEKVAYELPKENPAEVEEELRHWYEELLEYGSAEDYRKRTVRFLSEMPHEMGAEIIADMSGKEPDRSVRDVMHRCLQRILVISESEAICTKVKNALQRW